MDQGRYEDAVKLEEKVLKETERLLGPEHPDTVRAMANLAATYRSQGRYEDAVKLEEKVLKETERLLGPEHPDTVLAMANLAAIYQSQGRYEDAVEEKGDCKLGSNIFVGAPLE